MPDWQDIRYFLAVAACGTLSGAARHLGVDHATVSRRIAALEAALDARLVERLPRAIKLTALGLSVLERAREMETAADGIARLAKAAHAPLTGRITLSAPPVLVAPLLAAQLGRFHAQHPHILLSVSAQGQQVSLSHREADIIVRLVRPQEAGNVTRRIGTMPFALYAHRHYLERTPPQDWQFIAFDAQYADMPQQQWLLEIAGNRPVVCELNYISEHLIAARAGVGVAGLPRFLGDRDPELARIDAPVLTFQREIWIATHLDLRSTPAIRAVMDFVIEVIAADPLLGTSLSSN